MLRLVGFFVLALLLARVLAHLPIVGPLFASMGIFGVWIAAILLSWMISSHGARAYRVRRDRAALRRLEEVDTAHNHGKAGSLLMAQGRPRKALAHLRAAAEGEPDVAEWRYRHGCAALATGDRAVAREELEACVAIDPEHAYGAARMRLAETLLSMGEKEAALEALDALERDHGPSPEQAYRRGLVLRALGRRAEAGRSLAAVSRLARSAPAFQRREARVWMLRAWLARVI